MNLKLKVSERRLLNGKRKWSNKILGVIKLVNGDQFIFGRNPQTRRLISSIDEYPFLEVGLGIFNLDLKGEHYLFTNTGHNGVFLRKKISILRLFLGIGETK